MKINKGFITQKINGKLTLFKSETSELLSLNETGSYIFSKVKSGWVTERIEKAFKEKYHLSDEKAKKDIDEFIDVLKQEKIVSET